MDVTTLYYIFSILCNIVNTYIAYKFYHYVLGKEKTSKKHCSLLLAFTLQ